MIKFLLQRPVAVFMAFTACFIVGLVTYFSLPVSLLPNIDIPQITVQVTGENTSARELENTIVAPVRRLLLQVSGLNDIKSETRDGIGIIRMEFEFGTDTDLAFIEVNEKIDAAMGSLPKETIRPKAIKASATDIPVLYVNMMLKDNRPYQAPDEQKFLDLCELAENVIKRRIEQLPEVAMADITGVPGRMLQIVPDENKLKMAGVSIEDIEKALQANNVEPGSMMVKDGYYEYDIRISALLRTTEDVENIYIRKGERIMQLKDLCKVSIVSGKEEGRSVVDGKRAVTLAIIKQGDENMDNLKGKLKETIAYFSSLYPDVEFHVNRNQTELLDYTISNLQQNFTLGFLLVFIVAIIFLGDVRSPMIIGISMVASVVITFLLFYLCKVSLNVISLSGLILAVGMMVDSSIVVTENISQYRERGYSLKRSCVAGTSEIITPMLSSSLTTIAVFVPLIFMSGIAGAIFADQAFSITSGLFVSYITGIMLLPVIYLIFAKMGIRRKKMWGKWLHHDVGRGWLDRFYDKGIAWVFSHQKWVIGAVMITIPICFLLFLAIRKERMPAIDQNELVVHVEWNENIHIDENNHRIDELLEKVDGKVTEHAVYVGMQSYILNRSNTLSATEAEVYFKVNHYADIASLQTMIEHFFKDSYPRAVVDFAPPETIFEKIFVTGEADVVARLHTKSKTETIDMDDLRSLEENVADATGYRLESVAFNQQLNVVVDREKLLLYNVSYNELVRVLRTSLNESQVSVLRSFQQYLPMSIVGKEKSVNDVLATAMVSSMPDDEGRTVEIPIRALIKIVPSQDLKNIVAGKDGEYVPFHFYEVKDAPFLMGKVKDVVNENKKWDVDFSGAFFSNEQMMKELMAILVVSLLLMYFILCAQFESFIQPLIVLMEIPIDIAFALITLWVCGHTLNLMSAIGIIVTCGIVVNDSILKLDTINEYRKGGMHLWEAIHVAGKRRLRPIIMTSLTTIFAMVPLLFSFDMGSELQKPLSIAMIGSMVMGTLVSLFVIPLIYWLINKNNESKNIH